MNKHFKPAEVRSAEFQSKPAVMVTHPLSTVYGSYAIETAGRIEFATTDYDLLYEMLLGLNERQASNVRVLLLSGEDFGSDDITDLVFGDLFSRAVGDLPIETGEAWDALIGYEFPFLRDNIGEIDPTAERVRRQGEAAARDERTARITGRSIQNVCDERAMREVESA